MTTKLWKSLGLTALGLLFVLALGLSGAKAADLTVDGNLTVNGGASIKGDLYADHNWIKFNPSGYTGVDPTIDFMRGNSLIKEMGDPYYITDDYTHIGYTGGTGAVLIQNATEINSKSTTGGTGVLKAGATTLTSLSATTGTFTGAISGTTGTFSGDMTITGSTDLGNELGLYATTTAPATSTMGEGSLYYNTADDLIYVNTGTAAVPVWTALGTATAFNLNAAYGQFGAAASKVDLDAAEAQTGGMEWELTNSVDYLIDISSLLSEFKLQGSGTDTYVWNRDGALDVTPGAAVGEDIIDITRPNTATAGDVLDINMGTAAIAGDAIDIAFGAGISTGDAVVVDMGATNVDGGAFVVTAAGGARTDAIIDVTTASTTGDVANFVISGATTGHGLNIDYSGIATGNGVDVTYGTAAATGNAFAANMGTNLAGNALFIDLAGLRTGAGILIDDDSTRTAPAIDINVDTITTGNALDITYATAAATENAIDLNMGTNVAGDALNIGTAATTGNALDITATGVFTNELIDINTSAAWTGNLIDIDVGTAVSTGDVIDITYAGVAHTGNAIETNNGTNLAGNMLSMVGTGARTGNQVDITTDETGAGEVIDINVNGIKAAGGNIIDITTGAVANASNYFDINVGNAAQTGDIFNLAIPALPVALQTFVIDNDSASTTAGWLMDVDASAAWTGNAYNFIQSAGISTGDLFAYDNTGDTAVTGDFISYASGAGDVNGDVMDITIEAGATSAQIFDVNNAAISDEAGWLMEVDTTGIWSGTAMDFDLATAASTGNLFDVTYTDAAHTGNTIDLNMGTNVAGDAINIDTEATTAQAIEINFGGIFSDSLIDIDDTGNPAWTGNMFEVNTGTGSATGNVFDLTMELTALGDAQAFVINNADISDQAGWLLDLNTTAAWTGIAMDFNLGTAISTGALMNVTYAGAAHTGATFDINMGTNLAGNAMDIQAEGIRSAPLIFINGDNTDAGTDDHVIDIDQDGLLNSNVLDITFATAASDGNAIDLNMGTNVAGNAIDIATLAARAAGSAIEINDAGLAASVNAPLIDINVTGTADTSTMEMTFDTLIATGAGILIDNDTNVAGDMIYIDSDAAMTSGSAIQIDDNKGAGATAPTVDINGTGATVLPTVDIDSAGVMVDDEGILSVAGSGARLAGSSVLRVSSTGTPAAATSYLADFDYSGATMTNNPVAVYVASAASTASTLQVTDSGAKAAGAGTVDLINTNAGALGAVLNFNHDSASPADNDVIARTTYYADDDGAATTQFAKVDVTATDVSAATEDADMAFSVSVAGTVTQAMRIDSDVVGLLVGSGAAAATVSSDGAFDLTLSTNSTAANEPRIALTDGATGNITVTAGATSGEIDLASAVLFSSTQTLTGAGAMTLGVSINEWVTTAADAGTLAAGIEGQIKFVMLITDGGDGTLTLTGNPAAFDVVTFGDAGDAVILLYTNSVWYIVSNQGATIS